MDWGRVKFFWSEVAQNFTRNMGMALTAIGTVAVSIVLLGVVVFLRDSFDAVMRNVVSQLTVAVYLKDDVPKNRIDAMVKQLRADPRLDSVRFVSKKQAMLDLRRQLRGQMNLNVINTNPLPNTLLLHTVDPNDVPPIAAEMQAKPGVALVNYASRVTDKLLRAEAALSVAGLAIVGLLLIATVLIIHNTIRLTVFARQREINIMQLVGATSWAIRWPFVCEGILSGMIGATAGLVLLLIGYRTLVPKAAVNLPFLPIRLESVPIGHLALDLLVVGALVGMLASWFSVSRHLQAA